jgi:protein phosphatase
MFRNVILQALGAQGDVTPVTGRIRLRKGDILLLCSDGLSGKLRAEDIHNIVASNADLAKACDELIAEANNRGGEDNITVILARFTGNELAEPASDRITVELPPIEEEDKTLDDTYDPDTEPR